MNNSKCLHPFHFIQYFDGLYMFKGLTKLSSQSKFKSSKNVSPNNSDIFCKLPWKYPLVSSVFQACFLWAWFSVYKQVPPTGLLGPPVCPVLKPLIYGPPQADFKTLGGVVCRPDSLHGIHSNTQNPWPSERSMKRPLWDGIKDLLFSGRFQLFHPLKTRSAKRFAFI